MSRSPLFITFCGMDGVGKTTQAFLLVKKLRCSHKVKRVWIRSPHTLAYFIWRFFNTFGYYVPPINSRHRRLIWGIIETMSIIPKVLINVYLPRTLGFTLIGERYVVDSLATMTCYSLREPEFIHSKTSKFLLKFVPTSSLTILLDAKVTIIGKRRLARNSKYDEPVKRTPQAWLYPNEFAQEDSEKNPFGFLTPEQQRKVYLDLAKKIGAYIIDTSDMGIDEVHQIILKKLANYTKLYNE